MEESGSTFCPLCGDHVLIKPPDDSSPNWRLVLETVFQDEKDPLSADADRSPCAPCSKLIEEYGQCRIKLEQAERRLRRRRGDGRAKQGKPSAPPPKVFSDLELDLATSEALRRDGYRGTHSIGRKIPCA